MNGFIIKRYICTIGSLTNEKRILGQAERPQPNSQTPGKDQRLQDNRIYYKELINDFFQTS